MATLQAIIFDVDGTLAETERDGHRVAFNRAFAAANLSWHWDEDLYGELLTVAGGKERIRYFIDRYAQRDDPAYQLPAKLSDPADLSRLIADLHAAKTIHYRQLVQDGKIPLRPGVRRLMDEARQLGIRLAIATTSAPDNVIALLETALGSDSPDWFAVIAAGDIVPAKKPAPDIYHYVLDHLGLDPDGCLVIEDSQHGLAAASQAGLRTVVTVNDYTRHQDFSQAVLVLDHLGDVGQPARAIAGNLGTGTVLDVNLAQHLLTVPFPAR
ncbi:MAG: HAD family hydrolase [Synechococcales bacterium]|nr:HAD family hydrolase [Synechococcales bacterium]